MLDRYGIIKYDGYQYRGQVKDGMRHGKGTLYLNNHFKDFVVLAEGDYVNDLKHGYRKVIHGDGDICYESDCKWNKLEGLIANYVDG